MSKNSSLAEFHPETGLPLTGKVPKRTEPKTPVFRQIRSVPLVYGETVTAELPERCLFLGIHAQPDGGENGKFARTVTPKLMYEFRSDRPLKPVTLLTLRGEAELPADDTKNFDFLSATIDKNPRLSGFATVWLVSPRGGK